MITVSVVAGILGVLSIIMLALPFTLETIVYMDTMFAFFVNMIAAASWIIPMDVAIMSMVAITAMNNWYRLGNMIMFIIRKIPGIS